MMQDNGLIGIVGVKSKLVKLICKKKWAKVKKLLKSRAGISQARQCDAFRTAPLAVAVVQQPPLEIIEMLIAIDPSQPLHMDCYGMIPLHGACRNGASAEIVKALLQCNNGAGARAADLRSRTPLHYCMEYICNPLYQVQTTNDGDGNGRGDRYRDHRYHREELDLESSVTSLSTFQQTEFSESGTILSMSPEEFEDQLAVVKDLVSIAPKAVLCPDSNGNTPIDILQDCKASRTRGPKWERADIMCEYLRKNSVEVYKKEKAKHEMAGYDPRSRHPSGPKGSGSTPPSATSTNESSTLSGYSQLGSGNGGSRGGISHAMNSMVISACDDTLGLDSLERQNGDTAR
eukprot:205698_1